MQNFQLHSRKHLPIVISLS